MEKAASFLGRPYRVSGLVVEGGGNGRKIGFATANLELNYTYVFPKEGVYMGYGYFMNRRRKAMICVGTHPTIHQLMKPIIEVHIIDFNENLYSKEIEIHLLSYLREEIKFPDVTALKEQIESDADKALLIYNAGRSKNV